MIRRLAACFTLSCLASLAAAQTAPPGPAPEGMVWIPGGTFRMGSEEGLPDERPVHEVTVDGFWMDQTEITNSQFAKFVAETGYVTIAEQKPKAEDFPGVPEDKLVAGSVVFTPPPGPIPLNDFFQWWSYVPGANWRHPNGPESSIEGSDQHPVVHVAWDDAAAYCKWASKRLPTEAEWEFAARGGLEKQTYMWGEERNPGGAWLTNIWQGAFPHQNSKSDGFESTAPVGSFPANGYNLYDMSGNVWEWCADWYRPDYYETSPKTNPKGPESSHDPREPGIQKRVTRGGSYLCSDEYCIGYRPSARMKSSVDTGLGHTGFRCARTPDTR